MSRAPISSASPRAPISPGDPSSPGDQAVADDGATDPGPDGSDTAYGAGAATGAVPDPHHLLLGGDPGSPELAEPHPLADPPSEQQDSGDTQTTTLSDVQLHPVPEPDLPQVHFLA